MATPGITITCDLRGDGALATFGQRAKAMRTLLQREIAWARDEAYRMAVWRAVPPRRVMRVTPPPKQWQYRIKHGIDCPPTGDPYRAVVRSTYVGMAAGGGRPAPVGAFLEFGTGRRGAQGWRSALGSRAVLPASYRHGGRAGATPQPFMTPAYIVVSQRLIERVKRDVRGVMDRSWR